MELINENDLQNICGGGCSSLRSAATFFLIAGGIAILCSLNNSKKKVNPEITYKTITIKKYKTR